jgi:hypothetical protein
MLLRPLVKAAAQLDQSLAFQERLAFHGRPGLVEHIAQLEPARTVKVVAQTGLGELEEIGQGHHVSSQGLWAGVSYYTRLLQ